MAGWAEARATPGAVGQDAGYAAESLDRSLRSTIVMGIAAYQLLVIGVVLTSSEAESHRVALVAAHLGLCALAVLVSSHQAPLWVLAGALNAMMVVDWYVADSVDGALSFATAWLCNLSQFVPSMLMTGRQARVFSALIGFAVPAGLWVVHPDWLTSLVTAAVVTGLAIRWAGRMAIPALSGFARRVDDDLAASWRERQEMAVARAASMDAAEHARLLHDTAINTLSAIASGGGAISDLDLVRELCARDVETLEVLIAGSTIEAELDLERIVDLSALAVRREGLEDDDLARVVSLLPAQVTRALGGAVHEALLNVAKHAGTSEVTLLVADEDGELVVAVTDRGIGFDGRTVPGRGLAESVVARSAAVGIDVTVTTAPGAGTQVRFGYPLRPRKGVPEVHSTPHGHEDFIETVATIRDRASWFWTAATVFVGVVIEFTNRFGSLKWTYGMLAVVTGVGVLAWRDVRRRGTLSPAVATVVGAGAPVAFLLALAGVGFGHDEAILWQAIGASPPLVILLVHARTKVPLALAVIGVLLAAVMATVGVAQDAPQVAAVIPIGAVVALSVLAGGHLFSRTIEQVAGRAAAEQRAVAAARLESAALEAAATARDRWRHAGLQRCASLLRRLATGSVDPTNPATRAECAEEESYLRQVILLDPELFRMGHWLARGLAQARVREARLVVRTGDRDVEDDETAAELGDLLSEVVGSAPRGSEITVSLFATRDGLRFGLVGPTPLVTLAQQRWSPPAGWRSSVETFEGTDVMEVQS